MGTAGTSDVAAADALLPRISVERGHATAPAGQYSVLGSVPVAFDTKIAPTARLQPTTRPSTSKPAKVESPSTHLGLTTTPPLVFTLTQP